MSSTYNPELFQAAVRLGLAPRYRVHHQIARGGMASVFLADDRERDGAEVAVKVLHPELAAILGPTRFRQEILLLQRLRHRNVLPLLDYCEDGLLLYYTSPYVEGDSLRELIDRLGTVPLSLVLLIARDVAAALDYAHAQNVIHRDIKPANILIGPECPLVCDFGVARAIEQAGEDRISSSGLIIGTPDYMSPEQARGSTELDARSDVYSLGCVLYELLSGERPFAGPTTQAIIARQITEHPPSIRVVRPEVPEAMERAVLHALAKRPADRPASATELVRELEAR